jgi:AraC family transcriptional regulator
MEHKIQEKGEFKVVGIELISNVQECIKNNPYPALWQRFMPKASEIKNRVNEKEFFGPCFTISQDECSFRSLAAVEVSECEDVPEGMKCEKIPANKYAVFEYKGVLKDLNSFYAEISEYMKEKGLKENGFWFEFYDERFIPDSEDSIMEVWCGIEE